jgi:hypothetical protein
MHGAPLGLGQRRKPSPGRWGFRQWVSSESLTTGANALVSGRVSATVRRLFLGCATPVPASVAHLTSRAVSPWSIAVSVFRWRTGLVGGPRADGLAAEVFWCHVRYRFG